MKKNATKNPAAWSKSKDIIKKVFMALSPFAKTVLTVAANAQSIPILNPYGLVCGGLTLLITIADRELASREDVEKTLNYISRQLGLLNVVNEVPKADVSYTMLVNRAMDVKSAIMVYLAVQIFHESKRLGIVENIAITIFKGTEEYDSARSGLENAIQEFNAAFFYYGHRVGLKTYDRVEDVWVAVNSLLARSIPENKQLVDNFMVPYDKNEQFIGRADLIKKLRTMFCEVVPKQENHRVALLGMGGVGKTQTAIAYVYTYRTEYDWIYWISAATEVSLLSGFQEIGKRSGCVGALENLDGKASAQRVLAWLRSQEKWLIVIDNLDQVEIIKEYLPERGPTKHTLITTRNQDPKSIPARGLEVPLMSLDNSVDMLLTLSETDPDSQRDEAEKIVEELGHLPLAIEQAASYIREITGSLNTFLEDYREHRKEVYDWVPSGNRQYSYSLAKTFSASFEYIENQNPTTAQLLHIFSFLNPDSISLEFLQDGEQEMEEDIRALISKPIDLAKALLQLERLSLVKWTRTTRNVSMHRLVHVMMRDKLVENDQASVIMSMLVKAWAALILHTNSNTAYTIFLKHDQQLVIPLLEFIDLPTKACAELTGRIGTYLVKQSNYRTAERTLKKALAIYSKLADDDDPIALAFRLTLGSVIRELGRWDEAAEIQKAVLARFEDLFGEENILTARTMSHLGTTYVQQGKNTEAIEMLEKARAIFQKSPDTTRSDILLNVALLADAWRGSGDYQRTLEIVEPALSSLTKEDDDNAALLRMKAALSFSYFSLGRVDEATRLEEEILATKRRLYPEDHLQLFQQYNNLGMMYRGQGRLDEAARLLEQALAVSKKLVGEDHLRTVTAELNLGLTYRLQGRLFEGLELQEKAPKGSLQLFGEYYPLSLSAMAGVAQAYAVDWNRLDEAVELQERCLAGRQKKTRCESSRNIRHNGTARGHVPTSETIR